MTIAPMQKITLYGHRRDKAAAVLGLQNLGMVEIIAREGASAVPDVSPPGLVARGLAALRYLEKTYPKRPIARFTEDVDVEALVEEILTTRDRLREVSDQSDALEEKIAALTPFGQLPEGAGEGLGGYRLWGYHLPLKAAAKLPAELIYQEVGRDTKEVRIVVIAKDMVPADILPFPAIALGESLNALARELEAAEIEREALRDTRTRLTRYRGLLRKHQVKFQDKQARKHALRQMQDEDRFFWISGWAPASATDSLAKFAEANGLAIEFTEPAEQDTVPTLLANPPAYAGGEALVAFYQTPGYRAVDPSRVLFFSFPCFFAMILADAGYALLLTLALALGWKKISRSPTLAPMRPLLMLLCAFSLLYGMACGSYFGVAPPPGSLLAAVAILDPRDVNTMLVISILVGCAHLLIAHGMMLFSPVARPRRIAALGWILGMSGALTLWQGGEALATLAYALFAAAAALVAYGGSDRRVTNLTSLLRRVADGFLSLTGITKLFGDVMSYMRLFALGLAGASLAMTFNDLAAQIHESHPGIGLIFALIVLLVGHGLNLTLALMGGVVHGLRLNYIEFFNWSLGEEGRPFAPLHRKERVS
jgi:V/A-type H+-transporting ATPase subunit I